MCAGLWIRGVLQRRSFCKKTEDDRGCLNMANAMLTMNGFGSESHPMESSFHNSHFPRRTKNDPLLKAEHLNKPDQQIRHQHVRTPDKLKQNDHFRAVDQFKTPDLLRTANSYDPSNSIDLFQTTVHQADRQSNGSISSNSNSLYEENLTPKLFLDRYSLPRLVKIIPQEPVAGSIESGPMSLLSGQLLMYKHYKSGKIEARNETKMKNGAEMISLVVIPDTYQGWFSVVTERGQVKARCYNSIHRLVSSQVTVFLTLTDLVTYTHNNRTNSDGTRQQYCKMSVKSGQVLKLLAVYQDLANQSARSKRLSWPLIGRQEPNRYAQCLTSTDQVLFIPLTTHGQFYAVSMATNTTEDTVTKVYQLSKLLRIFPLPVRVCIISVDKPQGSLLLETYRKEEVILTCILDSKYDVPTSGDERQFRLLEIDVNSRFYVQRPTIRRSEERRLFHSLPVQTALRFCHESSDRWARQLKIIHHIYPKEIEKSVEKPRKVSLGDKKTVKSASFRFSTSYQPEDLRPMNRPLPRRPIEKRYTGGRSNPELPLYSNVPDESDDDSPHQLQVEQKPDSQNIWSRLLNPARASTKVQVEYRKTPGNFITVVSSEGNASRFNQIRNTSKISEASSPSCELAPKGHKTKISINSTSSRDTSTKLSSDSCLSSKDLISKGLANYSEDGYPKNQVQRLSVRKTVSVPVQVKPFYRTRVHVGADCADLPYSAVADQIVDDNIYAEIGDSYPTSDRRYFSFDYQGRIRKRYDYHHGGSDGTFSGTNTSSSNPEELSV